MAQDVSSARAYFEGMLWAAFGVNCTSDFVYKWQIDAVKECVSKLKGFEMITCHCHLLTREN